MGLRPFSDVEKERLDAIAPFVRDAFGGDSACPKLMETVGLSQQPVEVSQTGGIRHGGIGSFLETVSMAYMYCLKQRNADADGPQGGGIGHSCFQGRAFLAGVGTCDGRERCRG